ncbi:MAG: ribonuclease HII, partial [Acidaminococcaceae bacterium]|nr:ribonuclease HII [Acidaminococcaceae bacterium]
MKLQEIKSILAGKPTAEQLQEIRQDGRAGVQKLIAAYDKRLEKEKAERLRFENMLRFEKEYLA